MEFVVATNNKKKLAEIRRILESQGHSILSLEEAGIQANPEETGETFVDNAVIKAKYVCNLCGKPTLADDSGLVVDALNGAPGVYSARFAGEHSTDAQNNEKLLSLMARIPYAKRTAHFECVVVLQMPDGSGMAVEGRCSGHIGFKPHGGGGFGYDPLFYVDGRSFAEMTEQEKDEISHRAVALRRFVQELPQFLNGGVQ